MRAPNEKIMTLDEIVEWRSGLRAAGQSLVMTNGCFDILHKGHVEYLFKARNAGDSLLLALNSDVSARALKGPERPVNDQIARATILASLYFVDAVVVFDAIRCTNVIRSVVPDVYVKGGDYDLDTIDGEEKAALLEVGTRIQFIPLIPGFSTTGIISRLSR